MGLSWNQPQYCTCHRYHLLAMVHRVSNMPYASLHQLLLCGEATHIHSDVPTLLPEDGDLTGVCSELRPQNKHKQEMHSGVFSNPISYSCTLSL